jgi:hypothetical protein
MDHVKKMFSEQFNKALPQKATLLDWEKHMFTPGSVNPDCGTDDGKCT